MIKYFAGHPTAANLVMVSFIVVGLVTAANVKRETFPEVPANDVLVSVLYPGATAEDVEEAVCQRIEEAVEAVRNVEEIACESRENKATANIKMLEGKDFDGFLNDIKTEVEAIDNFPDQAEKPVIRKLGQVDFVAAVAVTGPMSAPDLKAFAENLKDQMLERPNISQVKITGFSDHQIRIELSAQTLRQYGISVTDIADIIARQSVDLPAGTIETSANDVLVRFSDERRRLLEFDNLIVVGSESGAEIKLGDIATITDVFERDEEKVVFNGVRAAVLEISKTKTEDTLKVIDSVNQFLDEQRARAPPNVKFTITRDISSIVRDRLTLLIKNGLQGLVLVTLTLFLFFSFRFSFWVAMGFPVSFLGTIAAMSFLGLSFDMITMVGMLIGIGLLVDDAIVIAENIAAHAAKGAEPLAAAINGTKEVMPGVISSFLTTICIFGSLGFLKGDIGAILKFMPIILIITLSVSLVEAFLVLPHHIKGSLAHTIGKPPARYRQVLENGILWLRDVVVLKIVDKAIAWRYLTLGLVLMAFLASISMLAGGKIKFRAFPDIEGNVVEARLLMPQGTPLARTESLIGEIATALGTINDQLTPEQPGKLSLVKNINVQFNKNIDAFEAGPHIATITVDLLGTELRTVSVDEMLNRWRKLVGRPADSISLKFTEPVIGPAGRAIDIRLSGENLDRLKSASLELQGWLGAYRGVLDLSDDLRPGKPEIRLRLRDGATALGLSSQTIASQLRSAFFGKTASEIQVGQEAYEIDVRLAKPDRTSLSDLEYFTVTSPGGDQVPLGAVAILENGRGVARINRIDRKRTVTIQGDIDTNLANTAEVLGDMMARFKPGFDKKYPGIRLELRGEVREGGQTQGSIRSGFGMGLIGVFLLLCFLFRHYVEPLIVMVTIPLELIGVVWGHFILGLNLSMPSIVGFASLAGVVVNNAILLVEFIKIQRRKGDTAAEAASHAARMRFRAILLTSTTTIMGLLPLLTETSVQAQVLIPLITSIAFGLLAVTFLILFVVPALYTILDDFGLTAKIEPDNDTSAAVPLPAE